MAEKLGITQQTYAGWERQSYTALRPERLVQLAGALNVPLDYLMAKLHKRGGGPVRRKSTSHV